MSSNSTIEDQWSDAEEQDPSNSYALSGKIMLTSMITLFVVVVLLVILHLYARWYLVRINRRRDTRHRRNRPTRVVFYVDNHRESPPSTGGLEASVLKSLPLFVYSSEKGGSTPECAVCLSEFEEGETGRVLPNCKHGFHIGCIDMWFYSHSTCPLCRSPVEPVEPEMPVLSEQRGCVTEPGSSASLSSPEVADRRKRVDVRIDVPERNDSVAETEFRLPSPSQGFRSPGSRLLSLKRILSMSIKSPVASPSCGVGPSCDSVESGESTRQEAVDESSRGVERLGEFTKLDVLAATV